MDALGSAAFFADGQTVAFAADARTLASTGLDDAVRWWTLSQYKTTMHFSQ